jgi:alpha-galactosidase
MTSWPISDREKLKAPGYVRMPGRPKTERRGEVIEPPKGSRMSKVGTIIRCTKCKQTGHNKTSCDKRNAASAGNPTAGSQAVGSQAAGTPHEMVVVSNTQSSRTTSKKRNPSTHTKNAAKVTTQHTILH